MLARFSGSALAKEILQECGGFGGQRPFDDFDAVVEEVRIGELELGADAAEAEVAGAEDEGFDAGVNEGAGAHDAGFEGDVDGRVFQAVVAEGAGGGAEEVDLGVGGGIAGGDGGVVGAGDDGVVDDENGADGDFAGGLGEAGFFERGEHVWIVIQAFYFNAFVIAKRGYVF